VKRPTQLARGHSSILTTQINHPIDLLPLPCARLVHHSTQSDPTPSHLLLRHPPLFQLRPQYGQLLRPDDSFKVRHIPQNLLLQLRLPSLPPNDPYLLPIRTNLRLLPLPESVKLPPFPFPQNAPNIHLKQPPRELIDLDFGTGPNCRSVVRFEDIGGVLLWLVNGELCPLCDVIYSR